MTSLRNNSEAGNSGPGSSEPTSTADRLLDAARESILSVGWKRTTLTDVARRAGVSRMTVYRTYPDMPGLFGDLMTREWAAVTQEVATAAAPAGPADAVAVQLTGALAALRGNELFRRIVDVDPELLLPYLLDRRGRSQQAVLDLLVAGITDAQAAGVARAGDPELLARALVLAAHGFVLSVHTMTDDSFSVEQLDAELADLVRRYLA
jgi:AcrR family transcriptional regulator